MKLIIAGSRSLDIIARDIEAFMEIHGLKFNKSWTIISGGCPTGPDNAAHSFALTWGLKFKEFPADWDRYGKRAGPIRNQEMADEGDALLLIWDGESAGSSSMRHAMTSRDKPVHEIVIKKS